jgi:hypothetical protein
MNLNLTIPHKQIISDLFNSAISLSELVDFISELTDYGDGYAVNFRDTVIKRLNEDKE